jgi:hypothetical protein
MAKQPLTVDIVVEVQAAAKALAPAVRRLARALGGLDPAKLPSGRASDLLYALRQAAKLPAALAAPFDDLIDPAVKALEEHFVKSLTVGESSGVQGMSSRTQVTETAVPVVKPSDWEKFFAYVAKTKQWDLLSRKVSAEAVRERWDAKKPVPHVSAFHVKKVSCTKLGGR